MKSLCFVAFLFCMIGAAACSQEAFNAATSTNAAGATAACSTGYVYTSAYGCEPQSTCSTGYALYNGQCVSTTSTPTSTPTPTPTTATTVTCPSGYFLTGTTCVQTVTVVNVVPEGNVCQGICAVGMIQTSYGCLPAAPYCPPCTGDGGDGFCYYATNYLAFLNGI
jgi:hypothetical protein